MGKNNKNLDYIFFRSGFIGILFVIKEIKMTSFSDVSMLSGISRILFVATALFSLVITVLSIETIDCFDVTS